MNTIAKYPLNDTQVLRKPSKRQIIVMLKVPLNDGDLSWAYGKSHQTGENR